MNVPEVEAFIEGKTLFTGIRVKNLEAARLSGRPATFSGGPVIYFLQNWPASCLSPQKWPAGSQRWPAMLQCISLALFYSLREVSNISVQWESQRPSSPSVSDAFRCPDRPKYTPLWLSFVYRVVVLIIELLFCLSSCLSSGRVSCF